MIAAFGAFLGRYNFGKSKFVIEGLNNKKDYILFNDELKRISGDFDTFINGITDYFCYCPKNMNREVLFRFCDTKESECKDFMDYNILCIEVNLNKNEERYRVNSKSNKMRLIEFLEEFEEYLECLLQKNYIIVDKSINVIISASIDKYYLQGELNKVFGYFNYSINAIDMLENSEDVGDLLHIVVYSLWDVADNNRSLSANCEAFELYNNKMQRKIADNTIVVILSGLNNINLNYEISSKIDSYQAKFISECKLYSNAILDFSGYSKTNIYNNMLYKLANIPYKQEFFNVIVKEIVWSYLKKNKKEYKLVVLDGDETLWDGIIADDGIEKIEIGVKKKKFQEKLKKIKEKGVLLAICSKNNISEIEKLFEENDKMILKKEDFITVVANFDSKYNNILKISNKYNIDLNNIVFIDDSTFECGEMMRRLPEVSTVLYSDMYDFSNIIQSIAPLHNILVTTEDKIRTSSTQKRTTLVDSIDKEKFWRELDAHYIFSFPENEDFPRIVQLNSRVNRYRLSLDNLSHNTIIERAKEKKSFVIRVNDKFGDYGIVSYISWIIDNETAIIDNWIMSCRLSSEYAEFLIWNFILNKLKSDNVTKIKMRYEDTNKNTRFLNFCGTMNLKSKDGYCECEIDYYCDKYDSQLADCKIQKYQNKAQREIATKFYDDNIEILDYKISKELFDVSRSRNSRNLWLLLGDNTNDSDSLCGNVDNLILLNELKNDKERIVFLWEKILKCVINDYEKSFIEFGGNSIMYMELISWILDYWNIDMSKIPFRLDDTILCHEHYIQEFKNTHINSMSKMGKKVFKIPELSKRFFSYSMDSPALHIPFLVNIDSRYASKQLLEDKIVNLFNRYRVFRSEFKYENKNVLVHVRDKIELEIKERYYEYDLPDDRFTNSLIRKFDCGKAQLVNIDLIHSKNGDYLLIDYCHIIVDGLSAARMTSYIIDEISSRSDGEKWSEQYYDYYDYCYNNNLVKTYGDEKYWLEELKGVQIIKELPFQENDYKGTNPVRIEINSSIMHRISKICSIRKITEFSFFLSTYALFLHTLTTSRDVTIGIPVNCKKSINTQYDIGQYVNTAVFRSVLSDMKESLINYYNNCNKKYIDAINHSNIMFQELATLCNKKYGVDSLFNTMFVYESEDLEKDFISLECCHNSYKSMIDLIIKRKADNAYIQINYDINKLSYLTSVEIGKLFNNYLLMIVDYWENNAEKRNIPLYFSENNIVKKGTKKTIGENTVIDIFMGKVRENAQRECFEISNNIYTYGNVNKITNVIAGNIVNRLGHYQKRILVICDNMEITAFSLISILKSRNVYVPVSSLSPESRIKEIIEKCLISAYIAEYRRDYIDKEFLEVDINSDKDECEDINYSGITDDAYIIYTSGTTGKSKGILIKNKGLVNTVIARNEKLKISEQDNTLLLMGSASDGYMTSFFSPIISGAKVFFPESIFDMKNIVELIQKKEIHTFLCTPTMYNSILNNSIGEMLGKIRLVALAGESIPDNLIEKSKTLYPNLQIANEYGPTENSICTSIQTNLVQGQAINAGKLINNVNGMIINNNNASCPEYVIGELYLSGYGLSEGYVGEDEYNITKFTIQNGIRWYKTGDLAYWDNNDNLIIVGRIDNQVKINGYRVDLNEIQDTLLNYPYINSCVVTFDEYKKLTAYYISDNKLTREELIGYLNKKLNRYMIPLKYVRVSYIPITEAGKTDTKMLEKYIINKKENIIQPKIESDNPIVLEVEEIFKSVLSVDSDSINATSDLFELGGSSIECVLIAERINKKYNVHIEIEDIRLKSNPIMLAEIIKYSNTQDENVVEFKPFNKFWFIDCFYTAILAVLRYYNKPIEKFVRQFTIESVEQRGEYKHKYNESVSISERLKSVGVECHSKIFSNNISDEIQYLLNKSLQILVHVDCYYLSYCNDYYQKEHCDHVLTIIGYKKTQKSYIVIDQKNLNSVSFSINTIDEEALIVSIKEAMKTRDSFYGVDYVFLTKNDNESNNVYYSQESQLYEVVNSTIKYLRNKKAETYVVAERLLNYFIIEKEIARYDNNQKEVKKIERNEVLLRRLLMKSLSKKEGINIREELIVVLENMNEE